MIKKLLNNKIVRYAVLGLASFLVINVGMFFFLKMTQPKMGARAETAKLADSTAHADSVAHNLAIMKPDSSADSTRSKTDTTQALAATQSADTAAKEPAPIAASLETPETPAMPPPPEPDNSISSVDSTPVASAPDSAPEQAAATDTVDNGAKQLAKLAKLLESVKPDEAAAIASNLDIDQIVNLVMKMKDRNAGQMLAAMAPEQAARVAARMSHAAERSRKNP
jgi:cytoskeletal protein RodZ